MLRVFVNAIVKISRHDQRISVRSSYPLGLSSTRGPRGRSERLK